MARRLLIALGVAASILGILAGDRGLFIVGTLAAIAAFAALDGNGGRKF